MSNDRTEKDSVASLCAAQPPRTIVEGNDIGKNGNYSGKATDLSAKGTRD